ncbi:hypothetical protein CAEBREN_15977 [Caenorhabditis brenneri]|uniref:Uncharacterized protein n=1 Tax=Caenorhabditis brenneri TaxID=135651 RepID=G0NIH2_CAEBE|nr:hypothetical protein CAEBREN_15977 [Caenorhabditis brenneri]
MKVLLVLSAILASTLALSDRPCSNNITNLWLDVVAVVDNSIGMSSDGLNSVAADLISVFSSSRIGSDPNEPRTTRVALVTYNVNATLKADLNKYQSNNDFLNGIFSDLKVGSSEESFLANGLALAEQLFFVKESSSSSRSHYQKVIIVYASAFEGIDSLSPLPVAQRLRTDGVTIITVGYNQDGDGVLKGLQEIATRSYNFTNTDGALIPKVQNALMQANCFCMNEWEQYRDSYADLFSPRHGVCLQLISLPAIWKAAQMSCRNRFKKAYLANEYDQKKHDFIFEKVKNTTGFNYPYSYHIGLNYVNGAWMWDQPENHQMIENTDFSYWIPGYPKAASQMSAVQNSQNSLATAWQNVAMYTVSSNYVCEVASCDTSNYCTPSGLIGL